MGDRRLGLALSGGGFRASFFHIGILARMAELNLLRDVESISTVSGGSIIGVYYYLHLKKLLERKADKDITQQDYLDLVAEIETGFLKAVRLNLRTRTFASVFHNIKMARRDYSRSDRIGELYDQYLYRPVMDKASNECVWMGDLKILPKENPHGDKFNPAVGHNEPRQHKVPIININATVLNTGHDWCFTAVDMGEVVHDDPLALDIDKNTRLLKARYENICNRNKGGFHLGQAVAASAGVPGIFPPLSVSDMYNWKVQLVDGGVYDNQGLEVLINGRFPCSHIIISDASGQMRDEHSPETGTLPVFMRTTDVLMGRVREQMLKSVFQDPARTACIMHLKEGLDVRGKYPRDATCPDQRDPEAKNDVVGLLSRVRTDLDSFTDVEATCLMARGYTLATRHVDDLNQKWTLTSVPPEAGKWFFQQAIPWLEYPEQAPVDLKRQLRAAESKMGKVLRLGFSLNLLIALFWFVLGLLTYLAAIYFVVEYFKPGFWSHAFKQLEEVKLLYALYVLFFMLAGTFLEWLGKAFKVLRLCRYPYKFFMGLVIRFMLPALGAIPVRLYLVTLDRYFIKQGRLSS